jgi:hypothetical protein
MTNKPARYQQPSPHQLLTRILDEPQLVAAVQALEPRALGKLIEHVGLEDCGEIVALATTEQLKRIFDDDLWKSERPGEDESFDADRFTLWLEVMLEAGEEFTVAKLVELPEDIVTLAFHRQILVIDIDQMALEMSESNRDTDLIEKALEGCLYQEFAEYRVISRRYDGWDVILSILLALDKDHHDLLQRILERCCWMSSEFIEENGGLYRVLTSEEVLEVDVAADREDRRAREGFIAPSAAASFLGLARTTDLQNVTTQPSDPVTRAYFRDVDSGADLKEKIRKKSPVRASGRRAEKSGVDRLMEILGEAEIVPKTGQELLLEATTTERSQKREGLFKRTLIELREKDPILQSKRVEQLAYLANVLTAGCSYSGRNLRPLEAARAAVATCNLGLEHLMKVGKKERSSTYASSILIEQSTDKLFRIGWRMLYQDVVLFTSHALELALVKTIKKGAFLESTAELGQIAKALHSASKAGKPWTARARLDGLDAIYDPITLAAMKSLIDECPTLRAPIVDVRVHRPESEPICIATEEQISNAQTFLARALSK